VSKRIFGKAPGIVQLKFLVDGVLLVGFVSILGTGLVISTWLDIPLGNYTDWLSIHIIASITTLLALLVKLALHWRWIARTTRETFSQAAISAIKPVNLQPVPIEKRSMDRQDFLKVIGVVAGGSLLALMSATKSLAALQDVATNTTTTSSSQSSTNDFPTWYSNQSGIPQSSARNLSTNSGCSIQCGNRCSFPERCHRYTDADNVNLCDFGECS
jgi:hypothetical protein